VSSGDSDKDNNNNNKNQSYRLEMMMIIMEIVNSAFENDGRVQACA
jgi:hypothetical protein